ncbi:hypothetical protein MMC14_010559 [Varicellaria rhodocarpa]|nr:hypothetical protein [Varicellaria rhodocarpa]
MQLQMKPGLLPGLGALVMEPNGHSDIVNALRLELLDLLDESWNVAGATYWGGDGDSGRSFYLLAIDDVPQGDADLAAVVGKGLDLDVKW